MYIYCVCTWQILSVNHKILKHNIGCSFSKNAEVHFNGFIQRHDGDLLFGIANHAIFGNVNPIAQRNRVTIIGGRNGGLQFVQRINNYRSFSG